MLFNQKKLRLQTELNICLNSVCNLNCCECQTFCTSNTEEKITSIKDIKNYIPIIKEYFIIKKINLLGGETLLYQNLIEVCKYLRQEFQNIEIIILTNGIKFNNISLQEYKIYQKLNITFEFSLYPLINLISNIKNYEEKLNLNIEIKDIRSTFYKLNFNQQGLNSQDKYFECNCSKNNPLQLFLFQNKLFKCALGPKFPLINLPIDNHDYLDLNNLNSQIIIDYLKNSLPMCKYCGAYELDENGNKDTYNADDIIIWHSQNKILSDPFHSLLWHYLYNYEKYYLYCHDCKQVINLLNNDYYLSKYNKNDYFLNIINILQIRFFKGEKDIYIPFSKYITEEELLFLQNNIFNIKNFLKINFYFVSIDKDIQTKRKLYKTFTPFSKENYGNFYFLEANNIKDGYKIFLENSYLNEKVVLNYKIND